MEFGGEFPKITLKSDSDGTLLSMISTYLPHMRSTRGAWQAEFGALRTHMKECQRRGERLMVGADTNLDRLAAAVARTTPTNDVAEASAELECVDAVLSATADLRLAVARPASGFQPTWMSYAAEGEERILDYFFVSLALRNGLRSVKVAAIAAAKTSHYAVRSELLLG